MDADTTIIKNQINKMISFLKGRPRKLMLPNGEEHKAVYAIVDLNDIKASHNEVTFGDTVGYPLENGRNINDRNYKDDISAQRNVQKIAENLNPETLISLSSTPSGTPIINKDGFVVSGNNRVMSLKLATKEYPQNYENYKKQLADDIDAFGFKGSIGSSLLMNDRIPLEGSSYNNPLSIKFTYPILVRIDESLPEKLNTEVLAAFNQDTKKGERPVDKAIKLSSILNSNERCKNAIIHIIDGYDTFSDLYSPTGRIDRKKLAENFVQCGLIPEAQLPIYFDNGEFTENGKDYIETLLSAIILDADALKVLGVEGVKRYRQTLISSLPVLIANETLKEGSLKKDISDAIVIQYKIVQSGGSLSDYTHSQSLFSEDKPSEKGLYINSLLRVGKNTFKAAIKKYTDAAKSNEGVSLFGENMSIAEIFDKTIKAVVDESDRKNIEQLFKKEVKMQPETKQNTTPIKDIKEGDYVEVYGYVIGEGVNPIGETKKIDEGVVTFKHGIHYLNLDNDNNRKYSYSNGYVLKDKKMATEKDLKQTPSFEYKGFELKRDNSSYTQGYFKIFKNGEELGEYNLSTLHTNGEKDGRENIYMQTDAEIKETIDYLLSDESFENPIKKAYKQTVNGVDVKISSEEEIPYNTDEEFYEGLFEQIDPKDDWQGNLMKERDIKQQLNSIVNNATPEDIEELFLNYWAWFNLNKKEDITEQQKVELKYYKGVDFAYKNPFEYNKAVEELLDTKNESFTAEEKVFMSNYSGYGGLEKFGAEGKGLLYEYYTPRLIVEKMWGLAYKYGFNGGNVLEPSCGVGEFIKFAPNKELVTGYEINLYSAKIAAILYPDAQIIKEAFETIFIKNRASIKNKLGGVKKYNLVIGNPPYGEFGGLYAGMGEKGYTKAENYIDYFISRGLDLLESNGLLIMIVGAEVAAGGKPFLSKGTSKAKQDIMEKSILVDAYRLPNGVFDRTDVLSDIIVLRKK